MYADLHIHSTFSDSTRTPEDIALQAKNRRVSLLSVCDHHSIDSYERLDTACGQNGVLPVLGIELGIDFNGENHHVLAYNFDKQNREMLGLIKLQSDISQKECENIILKMSMEYPELSLSDYLSYTPPREAGGWKYIHYAVEKGIFRTYEEGNASIFSKYYQAGEETFAVEEFCGIVKCAGGVPVLAHPGNRSGEELSRLFRAMQDRGIEGIECFYPSHSKETVEICLEYCRSNNLRITCGSDCHGEYDKSEGFTIGALRVPVDLLDLRGIR